MMARLAAVLPLALAALLPFTTGPAVAQSNVVIVSTTTSTQDSGLLDVLVPMFEKQTGLTVKTISVGTGQALALAARGEADVTLAHAPGLEKKYVDEGKMSNRRLVMYNDFIVIGPPDDPAKIKGTAEGAGRAQAHRGEPVALRLARGQVGDPRARARAVEAGRASSRRAPGTSSPDRGWDRPSASPTTGAPTR